MFVEKFVNLIILKLLKEQLIWDLAIYFQGLIEH